MNKVNSMVFDTNNAKEIAKFYELLKTLMTFGSVSESDYCDIHIRNEDSYVIFEWVQVPYSGDYGGRFVYVDEDERVFKEVVLPDNSIEYAEDEDEARSIRESWEVRHPDESSV